MLSLAPSEINETVLSHHTRTFSQSLNSGGLVLVTNPPPARHAFRPLSSQAPLPSTVYTPKSLDIVPLSLMLGVRAPGSLSVREKGGQGGKRGKDREVGRKERKNLSGCRSCD